MHRGKPIQHSLQWRFSHEGVDGLLMCMNALLLVVVGGVEFIIMYDYALLVVVGGLAFIIMYDF
jgi:hypothetical protein